MNVQNPASWKKFRQWLLSPLGQSFIAFESKQIEPLVQAIFGQHLIFLGELPLLEGLRQSPILHRVWVHSEAFVLAKGIQQGDYTHSISSCDEAPVKVSSGAYELVCEQRTEPATKSRLERRRVYSPLISRQDKLPLMSDEIDLIFLAHCLEFNVNPHEVLREAYAALKPEGHLLISGFNPWSLWGIWRYFVRYIKRVPWDAEWISLKRLKDWLALLGFDIIQVKTYFFRPPIENPIWLEKLSWLEKISRFLCPFLGASYVILVRKRVLRLTPLRVEWVKRKKMVAARGLEPATRQ